MRPTPNDQPRRDNPPTVARALVLYDGQCRLCQKSVAVLRRLDWRGELSFQDARETDRIPPMDPPLDPTRLLEEMHLVTPDRRRAYPGFEAFRWMAWRLPLLVLLAPLLYLPGVPALGNAVYRWVARNRFKLLPCHDGMCHLPPRRQEKDQRQGEADTRSGANLPAAGGQEVKRSGEVHFGH